MERMIEMIEQSVVMMLLLVMMISSDCAGRAGRQPGWLAGWLVLAWSYWRYCTLCTCTACIVLRFAAMGRGGRLSLPCVNHFRECAVSGLQFCSSRL